MREGANAFWQRMGLSGSSGDQRVVFDHYSNRWIANGFCAGVNEVCIGVSDTSNALGTWKGTKITAFATGTADYPTLSVNKDSVVIGTNNFTPNFSGTSLFTIPKADLLSGAPTVANMTRFDATGSPVNDRGFAIQGVTNWTSESANSHNILAVSNQQFDVFGYRLNGTNAAGATQSAVTELNVPIYTFNDRGRQPDTLPGQVNNTSNRLVDTLDDRISGGVVQVNGKIIGIHTVTPTGVPSANNRYTELRWYVVDANSFALLSTGTIGGGNFDYYEGSLAINEFGDVIIGYNRSGWQTGDANGDGFADGRISFLGRQMKLIGNSLVQQGDDLLFRVSDVGDYRCGPLTSVDTTCRQRWGDYSAVTLDPDDPFMFYAIGEYAAFSSDFSATQNGSLIRSNWHTYIAVVDLDPDTARIPEPGTLVLLGLGLAGLAAARSRRRQ
jgi:hypothetical protein